MSNTLSTSTHGLYTCAHDGDDCPDFPWSAEMPRDLLDDYQPLCPGCGHPAFLVAPLEAVSR
jgi:hypothetical protein